MLLSPSYHSAAGCHRNGILAGWEMLKQSVHARRFYHARYCPTLDTCVALLSWQPYLQSVIAYKVAPITMWTAASLDRWAALKSEVEQVFLYTVHRICRSIAIKDYSLYVCLHSALYLRCLFVFGCRWCGNEKCVDAHQYSFEMFYSVC